METTLVALALIALAVALVAVGLAGVLERLPRNRWIGLRTASVQDDDESWRMGHRAAGGAVIAAAGPPLLLGLALIAAPPENLEDWLLILIAVGLITGGLLALSSRQARQALAPPDGEQQETR
jgi:hypothetical protein